MIKFFRKIRQKLLVENRVSKYLLYAVGEIILVVIGILIALQINNWNEDKKDRKLEKQYIIGLINDLETDSLTIAKSKITSDDQLERKEKLISYFNGKEFSNDSVAYFFEKQWGVAYGFYPVTVTLEEMKTTGGFSKIQEASIRKKIITTYNIYQEFIQGNQAYYEKNREVLRTMAFKIPNVFDGETLNKSKPPNIIEALKQDELKNGILANYAITINRDLVMLQNINQELLFILKNYLETLKNI